MEGRITLSHGAGGRLSWELIEGSLIPRLGWKDLGLMDSGIVEVEGVKMAFTTDSFLVKPPFFPGGDIGKLSVFGTVNDLAVSGARPLFLTLSIIVEEGFPRDDLERVVGSVGEACRVCGVCVVSGDTKVVEKGKGDGIFLNTSGLGVVVKDVSPGLIEVGDVVLVNGPVGDHEASILVSRKELGFSVDIKSDCAPIHGKALELLERVEVHAMRDPTRGGLATTLNEMARASGKGIVVYEESIPIREEVRAICEILGFDPLYLACEGRFVAFVKKGFEDKALEVMGEEARIIGEVVEDHPGRVVLKTSLGGERVLDMLSGEQLPRIC